MREGWINTTIKSLVAEGIIEKPLDGNHGEIHPKKSDFVEVGVPFIMASDLKNGIVDINNCYYISEEQAKKLRKGFAKNEDVLISHKGTIGRTAIVNCEKEFIVLTPQVSYYRILKKDLLWNKYLRHYFNGPDFQLDMQSYAKAGSTRAYIGITKQLELNFSYPPLSEQKQIVDILDKAFDAIDQAKANIEKNIQNAKELFQSKLNEIFSQKGGDWEEKVLTDVCQVLNGYSFKSGDFSPDNEIKSIKITNVGIMKFVEDSANNLPSSFLEDYSKVKVNEGDLVLALTRTIISGGLKVARVPNSYHNSLLNQRVAAITPINEVIDSDYLYYYFSSGIVYNYVLDNVNTLMQPNLSIGDLKKMNVPVTSIEGQKQISLQIEELSSCTNSLIENYNIKLENIEELKKSILQKAFSGELTNKMVEA